MSAAPIAAALRVFALGMGCHDFLLYIQRTGKMPVQMIFNNEASRIIAAEGSDVKPETL